MTNSDKKQVDENDNKIQEAIEELRILVLAGKTDGYYLRTDDAFLLRYLHCCEFNPQNAWLRMQQVYKLKASHPNWYGSLPPGEYSPITDNNVKFMLRERDRCGRRIYVIKMGKVDASRTTCEMMAQIDDLWMETILDEPETQSNGMSVLLDMSGYSWRLFRWLTPGNMRISSQKADIAPFCKISYHVVNSSKLMNAAISLVFPFLSAKTKEMVHFHYTNWPTLHEHIDPDILPVEYGGHKDHLDYEKIYEQLFGNADKLAEGFKYGYKKSG